MRRFGCGVSAVLLLLVLTACTGVSGYPIFDREPTAADELPPSFDDIDMSEYDLSTVRWSASHESVDFYLIRTTDGMSTCLAVAAAEQSSVACGGAAGVTVGAPGVYDAQLVHAPAVDGDGYTAVSENVRVRD
jgi:hypothetical protein